MDSQLTETTHKITHLAPIERSFLSRLEERLSLLKIIVEQNSFTTNREGVHKVQSLIENQFWALGLYTSRVASPKRADILIAETILNSSNPILLVGHSDTVHPVSSSFKEFQIDGNIVKGPGVLDMKGGLIHIFLLLDILKDLDLLTKIPLKIIINSAEENSTPMSAKIMQQISTGAKEALVFEIGRAEGGIVTQRKGIAEGWIHVKGLAAHSGNNFLDGKNAILPLCQLALQCASLTDFDKGVTVNIAQIKGGEHFCVVPAQSSLGFEMRGCSEEDMNYTLDRIKDFVKETPDATFNLETFTAPLNKIPETDSLFLDFKSCAEQVGFFVKELPRVGGLSDANLIGSLGIPTLDALGPYGQGAHTDNEYIELSSIKPRVMAVANYIVTKYSSYASH